MIPPTNPKQVVWLEALAHLSKSTDIVALETGRSRSPDWVDTDGDSTSFLSSLNCIGALISVDDDSENFSGYETTREYCNESLSASQLAKIVFLDGDSVEMISSQLGDQAVLDFVLLDSSNNPDVIFREFLAVSKFLNKQQVAVVIDDVSPPGQKGDKLIPYLAGLGYKEHRRKAPPGDCSFFILENMGHVVAEVRDFMEYFDKVMDRHLVRVVLDVGSRDAEMAIAFREYFPDATVYAFECNPPAVELCRQKIRHRDIVLVDKAISDECGLVDFYAIDPEKTITSWPDGNIGASSLYIANPAYPEETYYQNKIVVEAITLERWAANSGVDAIDILWMDLQGAELKALRGMGNLLKTVKVIYTEVGYQELYLGQPLFDEVNHYLTSHDFHLYAKPFTSNWFGYALYIRNDFISDTQESGGNL